MCVLKVDEQLLFHNVTSFVLDASVSTKNYIDYIENNPWEMLVIHLLIKDTYYFKFIHQSKVQH